MSMYATLGEDLQLEITALVTGIFGIEKVFHVIITLRSEAD